MNEPTQRAAPSKPAKPRQMSLDGYAAAAERNGTAQRFGAFAHEATPAQGPTRLAGQPVAPPATPPGQEPTSVTADVAPTPAKPNPRTPEQLADAYLAKTMAERRAVYSEATRRAARVAWLQGDSQHIDHQRFVEFVREINQSNGSPTHLFLSPSALDRAAWAQSQKNPIVARFLERYQDNTGETYRLSQHEAANIGALISVTRSGEQPNSTFRTHLLNLLNEARASSSGEASAKLSFTGLADSYMAGGLGRFTAFYEGTLSVDKSGHWKFDGNMRFYDEWDFDAGAKGRSADGQARLQFAREHLHGTGFAVVGPSIPFVEYSGEGEARWAGTGKAPESGVTDVGATGKRVATDVR